MRAFAHIIVTQLHGHWSASFSGRPEFSHGGANPTAAIRRLIAATSSDLDSEEVVSLDGAIKDGHLEFLVPYTHRWRIPEVSMN